MLTLNSMNTKSDSNFRNYSDSTRSGVRDFYYLNHTHQTVDFVRESQQKFLPARNRVMGIFEAMEYLDLLVDDSDPDIALPQISHAIQTAEAIRRDHHPDWFVLVGLIHDMGKVLCLFDEPQWAVTGDTFPVGCRYSDKIVYHEFFVDNPDWQVEEYQTKFGIYEENCGLNNILLSWGHDEYLYQVTRNYLPPQAQYMIRYHSFYAAHTGNDYGYLMNDQDLRMLSWVRRFNTYDLYTKSDVAPDIAVVKPYYRDLVDRFFPDKLWW